MMARQGLVDRVADAAEKLPDLIVRQRIRQPLLPRRGDPFFPEQLPDTAGPVPVVETQPVMTGLEGAARHIPLAHAEQVAPHRFFAEQIGRAAVMRRQPAHRLDVQLPRPFSQSGQDHVIDHPRTLWRHGGLLSVMFRRAASRPPTRKDTPANHPSRLRQPCTSLGEAVPSNAFQTDCRRLTGQQ